MTMQCFKMLVIVVCSLCAAQVQLLVSNSDVENYKQIKSDLDELRLLVEKSELWVYKSKKDLPTETRARKITPGLVGLRKDGGSSSSKEPEQRKDSLEQQDLEVVSTSTSQVKPPPNDRNMSTQHIATLLGLKCFARLVSQLRCVAALGVVGSFDHFQY